jgi:hypothetical protein
MLGLLGCFDLLKSGYMFVHFVSPLGLRNVWLVGQFLKNCLARIGAKTD